MEFYLFEKETKVFDALHWLVTMFLHVPNKAEQMAYLICRNSVLMTPILIRITPMRPTFKKNYKKAICLCLDELSF